MAFRPRIPTGTGRVQRASSRLATGGLSRKPKARTRGGARGHFERVRPFTGSARADRSLAAPGRATQGPRPVKRVSEVARAGRRGVSAQAHRVLKGGPRKRSGRKATKRPVRPGVRTRKRRR